MTQKKDKDNTAKLAAVDEVRRLSKQLAQEITDRRRAENALKKSELQKQAILDASVDMIINVSTDMEIIWANRTAWEGIGFGSPDKMTGRKCHEVFLKQEDPCTDCAIYECLRTGKIEHAINFRRNVTNIGDSWWESFGIPLKNECGQITGAIEVVRNITERKQAEDALRKANNDLKARVDELATLSCITRTVAMTRDLHTALESVSRQIREMFNAGSANIALFDAARQEMTIVAQHTPDETEPSLINFVMPETPALTRVIETGQSLVIPSARTNPMLEPVNELMRAMQTDSLMMVPLHVPDKLIGVINLSSLQPEREFTPGEVKLVEMIAGQIAGVIENTRLFDEAQQARKNAENANKAKSEFLANMSHEIRTPMNAVLGFTELLSGLITEPVQKSYLEAIKSGGKSLITLIDDILDLSKIEAGKMKIQYEPVIPYLIFKETENIFSLKIAEKQVDFITDISKDIPERLLLDEVRFRQILFNLIGNAVKFTEKGYIKISARKTPSQENKLKIDLTITVEDTGIGIHPESQEKIFEAFRQQSEQSTRKYGGTGLGLAITKRLVEMMNGSISLRSEVNRGTIFEIILYGVSIAASGHGTRKMPCHRNIIFKNATILSADDVEMNRQLLRAYFQDTSIRVIEAENGEQAVFFAEQYEPDIILMDILMPVMNGYEAVKLIKENEKLKSIPVIALTAFAMRQEKEIIMSAGFDGYLTKPVQQSDLFNELSHFIPYSEKENAEHEKTDKVKTSPQPSGKRGIFSLKTTFVLPELIQVLENEFVPKWEDIMETLIFDEIEEFAEQVNEQGLKYACIPLTNWTKMVMRQIRNIDMDGLSGVFGKFPEIIEHVRKIAET